MVLTISSLVNEIFERRLFVLLKESIGSLLVLKYRLANEISPMLKENRLGKLISTVKRNA